jgi:excisionase family DNA binding protein
MAHPIGVDPRSEAKPPKAVRQASGAIQVVGPVLLTPEQTASALSICRTKVYGLIRAGQLESVQIGASRRIPMEALEDYVRQLRASSKVYAHRGDSVDRSVT